jgi:two-component system cell cycle sensor histidine kinase/response regulator CckA
MSDNPEGNGETILVVDDEEIFRDFLVVALKSANFNVISANSGPNAVALAAKTKGKIDLLLTDWDMPEMSGMRSVKL